jgi:large subunit ribosomal protein L21e
MGHSKGLRSGTRYAFSRTFRQHGASGLTTFMRPFNVGDYVDIVVNGSVHKGMPFKLFHGRTGIIYNVTRRAVGVEINKQVRGRIEKKRVNVRVDHIRPSTCRQGFLNRKAANEEVRHHSIPPQAVQQCVVLLHP